MKTKFLIILVILIGLGAGGFFVYKNLSQPKKPEEISKTSGKEVPTGEGLEEESPEKSEEQNEEQEEIIEKEETAVAGKEETVTPSVQKPEVWIKEKGIRVGNGVSSCTVLLSDGTYRMYYTGMGDILSAVSTDGLNWAKETGARINRGANPTIIKLANGNYRMIYNEQEGIPPDATLWFVSTISSDGINWTKESGIRLKGDGAPDSGAISVPDIIELPDGRHRMYYVGDMFNKGPQNKRNSIRCAVSSDNGWTWERETISGIPAQSMDPDVITLPNGSYYMFFTGSPPGKWPGNLHVYSAISNDGLNWAEEEGVRLAPGGTYDKELCLDPDVVKLSDGSYRMYYSGQNEEFSDTIHILSAKSP